MTSDHAKASEDNLYETLPFSLRIRVRERFDYHCAYCGWKMGKHLTIDHVIPRSSLGTDDISNLMPACSTCNEAKGDHSLEVFRMIIAAGPRSWRLRWSGPFVKRLTRRYPNPPRKLWYEQWAHTQSHTS